MRAGAEQADVVVACTGLDEVNIVSCAWRADLGPANDVFRLPRGLSQQSSEGGLADSASIA